MKVAIPALLLALTACATEPQHPLDIDVFVTDHFVYAYVNASDPVDDGIGLRLSFPAAGECTSSASDLFISVPTCVQSIAFVGGGERSDVWLRHDPAQWYRETMPADLALEVGGCGPVTPRIAIGLPDETSAMVDVQFGTPTQVSWHSDIPADSAVVEYYGDFGGAHCLVPGTMHTFDQWASPVVSVTLVAPPVTSEGAWGTARLWRGGKTTTVRMN